MKNKLRKRTMVMARIVALNIDDDDAEDDDDDDNGGGGGNDNNSNTINNEINIISFSDNLYVKQNNLLIYNIIIMSFINRRQSSLLLIIPASSYGAAFQYSWMIERGLPVIMHHSNPRPFVWSIALLINFPTICFRSAGLCQKSIFRFCVLLFSGQQINFMVCGHEWAGCVLDIEVAADKSSLQLKLRLQNCIHCETKKSNSRTCSLYNNCANSFVTRQWITWYI